MANLSELLEKIVTKINASVKTEAQTWTDTEKAQARENIGAAPETIMTAQHKAITWDGDIANFTEDQFVQGSGGVPLARILNKGLDLTNVESVTITYGSAMGRQSVTIDKSQLEVTVNDDGIGELKQKNNPNELCISVTDSILDTIPEDAPDGAYEEVAAMIGVYFACDVFRTGTDSDPIWYVSAVNYKNEAIKPDCIPSTIPNVQTAEVGQAVVVKAVDENGAPIEWECADSNVRINLLDYGVDLYALFVAGGGSCAITNHTDLYNKIQTKENVMLVCTSALEPFNGYQLEIAAVKSAWGNVFTQLTANGVIRHSSVDYELSLIIKDVDSDSAKAVLVVEQLGESGAAENEIFVAEYGVTAYAEIMAAHEAGKACFVKRGNYLFLVTRIESTQIRAVGMSSLGQSQEITVKSDSTWSYSVNSIQSNALTKEINETSTDAKYPSAKAVYDHVAEKTTKTISLDDYDGGDAGSSLSYIIFSMLQEGTEKFSGVMSEEFFAACNVDSPIRLTTGIAGPIVHIDNVTRGYYNGECVQVSFPIRIDHISTLYIADVIISDVGIIVKQQPTNSAVPPVVELTTVVTNGAVLTEEESAALTAAYESGLPCTIRCIIKIGEDKLSEFYFTTHKYPDMQGFVIQFMNYMVIIAMMDDTGLWTCMMQDYVSSLLPTYTNVSEVGA